MDFELTSEQQAIRDTCRDFAREVIAPAAEDLDRNHKFGYDIVRQMGELGLFGLPFAEEAGGAGADFLSLCLGIEEISRADAGVGITLEAAVCLGSSPIYEFGTKEQKERWLPDLVSGRKLWSFGLTEPEAGSDAGATKTRAELRDGKWVINGAKQFITNCGTDISAGVTITAVTGRNGAGPEISAIMVPTGTPGYHVLESYRKLGWHSSDTHPLSFEDCEVPAENLLGERGGGYRQFLHTLTGGRIAIADRVSGRGRVWEGGGGDDGRGEDARRDVEALCLGGVEEGGGQRGPDPWRVRVHGGLSRGEVLAGREGERDRRGDLRGPADTDRPPPRRVDRFCAKRAQGRRLIHAFGAKRA